MCPTTYRVKAMQDSRCVISSTSLLHLPRVLDLLQFTIHLCIYFYLLQFIKHSFVLYLALVEFRSGLLDRRPSFLNVFINNHRNDCKQIAGNSVQASQIFQGNLNLPSITGKLQTSRTGPAHALRPLQRSRGPRVTVHLPGVAGGGGGRRARRGPWPCFYSTGRSG